MNNTYIFLSQGKRNQLHQYGYYFTMTFYKLVNSVVYYKLEFGKQTGEKPNETITSGYAYVRFSELYNLNLYHERFPRRTVFKNTSPVFIQRRLAMFKDWFAYILEDKNKCEALFTALNKLETKTIL